MEKEDYRDFMSKATGINVHKFEKEVVDEDGSVRFVRDVLTEFHETIVTPSIKKDRGLIVGGTIQSRKEYEDMMVKRRKNSMNFFGLADQIDDEVFSMSYSQAIAAGLLSWPRSYRQAYEDCKGWSEKTPFKISDVKTRAIYLTGPSRIGKTLFLKLKAIEIYDNEKSDNKRNFSIGLCRFINLQNFFMVYIRADEKVKSRMEHEFQNTKYLFIDDIGANFDTAWFNSVFQDLIGRRLFQKFSDGERVWTFFTSNFKIDDLAYDKPIRERIREAAMEIIIGETEKTTIRNSYGKKNDPHANSSFNIPRNV